MRLALMVAVYQKQLKLSSLRRRRHSTGEIVNYIAVDAYRMGEFPWWLHSTWSYVLKLFLAIGVLFWVVGLGALPGLIHFLICGTLNVPFAKALQKCILFKSVPLNASTIFMVLASVRSMGEPVRMIPEVLNVFLLDDELKDDEVDVFGTIAYVSQTAWIQSGRVRDNILYGRPMDKTKYKNAIKACALDKDIDSFDHEKQRIQLARAVYSDTNIYLFYDSFSAVDAHTSATLCHECVMATLAKKIVLLVTHQVEFLSEVDKILVMEVGHVTQSGSYESLLTAGTAFEQLVHAHRDTAVSTYWLTLGIQMPNITNGMLINVYTTISTFSAVFVYLRSFSTAHMGLKASKAFFSGFNDAIFKVPMLFFDSTPAG
ncbi:ABC transporter C family member 8 [Pyrus ussuriensis x Pyrus communis]|uniref:ABC transporter C family member 8 n=1 Tax=Pyrus ussuriensis x Pyrus communis TaxID=2448454 RepID=A0A5N5G714_9ROSA|nr:ABC transporter C family member 8 [Pyrus ussuriensis x Pyrus communis]